MRLVFDLESNGLLPELYTIHCVAIQDADTGKTWRFRNTPAMDTMAEGLRLLENAEVIIGHNIIKFDIPAIQKVYPKWRPKGKIFDTLVASRLIWTHVKDIDYKTNRRGQLPGKLIGSHGLEAWGYRLGDYKGDYKGPWDRWSVEMDDYCAQDTAVTTKLFQFIESKEYSQEALDLEHEVAHILWRQERHGFLFDHEAAIDLYTILVEEQEKLKAELQEFFPPKYIKVKEWTPKRDNKRLGYTAGVPMTTIKLIEFNPTSRDHIADRLIKTRGWKPKAYTPGGKPQVDEHVLKDLPYPEAKKLARYMLLDKRIGQVANGSQAWLKQVDEHTGRIHGSVNGNGAVTGRMTHSHPNVAQVPAVRSPYGKECRACWTVPSGKRLVGVDASGLELRCLAHYMARWDNGEYAKVILEEDIHSFNQERAGLPARDTAKTFIYAFLYGAGVGKIGEIIGKGPKAGSKLRKMFLDSLPALKKLQEAVQQAAQRGYLIGLDGRRLHVRSAHSALNTLLQSAGALVMKKGLVLMDKDLQSRGLIPGKNYEFVANVHDEYQIEADKDCAKTVGEAAVKGIITGGAYFNFRIPLDGEYKIGSNWAETH